jgi:hypothetical protein
MTQGHKIEVADKVSIARITEYRRLTNHVDGDDYAHDWCHDY